MGLNLRGESSGSVELNAPSSGGDVNITVPGQDGTLIIENTSGIASATSLLVGSGVTITSGGIDMAVGVTTIGGALEIFRENNDSIIAETGGGDLVLRSNGPTIQMTKGTSENMLVARPDGAVELYHDNSKKFETTSTGSVVTGILTASSQLVVNGNAYPSAGPLSNRNMVINGAQQVDQRNNGGSLTPSVTSEYALDRFRVIQGNLSVSIQQRTDVVPDGFTHAARVTLDTSRVPDSNHQYFYGTSFERNSVGHLRYGQSDAKDTTLSFWVRSSLAGKYAVSLANDLANRSFVANYTINSTNTWEYKTISIPGDTGGTWSNTGNGRHSFLNWDLGAGSDFDGTADTWQAGNRRRTSDTVDWLSESAGATFFLTGVQWEVGTVSTPFEHRDYGAELAKCERYYQQSYNGSTPTGNNGGTICATCCGNTNRAFGNVYWSTTMRQAPTVTWFAGSNGTQNKWRNNSQGTDITAATPNSAIGDRGYGFVLSSGISAVTDTLVGHYTADAEM